MSVILVTGGVGFIGTNLCKKLLSSGHRVIALDSLITADANNTTICAKDTNYEFINHDIVNPLPEYLFSEHLHVSSIFHLACPTGVNNIVPLAEAMLLTSSVGTKNVLDLARVKKAKVVFTSSSEAYGSSQHFPQNEKDTGDVSTIGLRSPYEEGKRAGEAFVSVYVRKYNIDVKIVRLFNTYGKYMSYADTRVIPHFIRQMKENKPLTLHGRGEQTRTFCYVEDAIRGILLVDDKGKMGNIYNLGSQEEITIQDLAELLMKLSGIEKDIRHIPQISDPLSRRVPDLDKAHTLGWSISTSLQDGLQQTLKWYGF